MCLSLFEWAEYRRTKGAVKLHLFLDHDGYLPVYAYISNGKKHDVTIAKQVPLSPGSIVAIDRGYNDYRLFAYFTGRKIFSVTRQKENALYEVVKNNPVPMNRNILSDQFIRVTGFYAQKTVRIFSGALLSGTRKRTGRLFFLRTIWNSEQQPYLIFTKTAGRLSFSLRP